MSKSLYQIEIKKSRGSDNENGNINIKFHIEKLTINNQQLILKINHQSFLKSINHEKYYYLFHSFLFLTDKQSNGSGNF